jgi:hypothetical protein
MSFFDDTDVPSPPAEEDEYVPPEWFGPPRDWVGGVIPVELIVGQTEKAAVYLAAMVVYPTGVSMTIEAITREWTDFTVFDIARPGGSEPDAERLRLGIAYSDGRKATRLGGVPGATAYAGVAAAEDPPDPERDLLMMPGGGGASGRHSHQDYWVWPLPPPGPVTFVCEWAALEIAESAVELDGSLIREAAERARSVWDD